MNSNNGHEDLDSLPRGSETQLIRSMSEAQKCLNIALNSWRLGSNIPKGSYMSGEIGHNSCCEGEAGSCISCVGAIGPNPGKLVLAKASCIFIVTSSGLLWVYSQGLLTRQLPLAQAGDNPWPKQVLTGT